MENQLEKLFIDEDDDPPTPTPAKYIIILIGN